MRILGSGRGLVVAAIVAASTAVAAPGATGTGHATQSPRHWVASWLASPTDSIFPADAAGQLVPQPDDQTLRMVVTPHLAAKVLRIHLSNRFGSAPLHLGHVTVGIQHATAVRRTRTVSFAHHRMVTISPHGEVASDRVHLPFRSFDRLAVSIYVPDLEPLPTKHWDANATSYSSPPGSGDLSKQPGNAAFSMPTDAWLYVDAIDVRASGSAGAVVAFGDSITDGFVAASPASEPVSLAIADKNGRYPDDLQRRINAASLPLSVVNAGIGSNRLVTDGEPLFLGPSGVQRFRRDALDVAGVRGVIVQEGINDLGIPPATTTPADLIAGYRTLITMAHAAHVKIWLGTILPASNAVFDGTALAPKSERYREQVNRWIRHQHQADGVIDFAARLRDPAIHTVLNPRYSGPDHLHPNLAGYRVMARTAKLGLLATALRK